MAVWSQSDALVLLVNVILASLATFLMIHHLDYIGVAVDGKRVSEYVSFPRYLDIAIRSSSINFRLNALSLGSTGQLGVFGYLPALLQVAGFAVGGFAAYNLLQGQPYCNRCSQYVRRKVEVRECPKCEGTGQSTPFIGSLTKAGARSRS
jgi:hypothetical protein